MARWREFEQLASQILAELEPDATVVWNDSIYGHLTEAPRQIDVSIRWHDGPSHYLTIVQAKDLSAPADIGIVDEFSAVVRDVNASGGILICRSGFSKTAQTYARNCGIRLMNIHDAQSANWSLQLSIPILWLELTPIISTQAVVYLEAGDSFPTRDPLGMPLTYDVPTKRIDVMSSFKRHWNSPGTDRRPGMDHFIRADKPVKAIVRDSASAIVTRDVHDFAIKYVVEQKSWLGRFRPSECRGIVDYLNDSAFVASHLPVSTVPFTRDDHWEAIPDVSRVAVNLKGTVVTCQKVVLIDSLTSEELSISYLGTDPQTG